MSYALSLFAGAGWQFFDNNGEILSGGKLYTYAAGSTTPLVTYTSSAAVSANPNPIILDSAGRVPSEIWIDSSYISKFILKTSTNVLIGTWDNIPSLISSLNLTGTNNGIAYFNSVGTFTSGSNLTFDGSNLGVAGAATIGSNLTVAGPSTLTGNVTASGALSVTGATTLSGAATVQGATTLNGTLSVAGNVTGTLNVTGTMKTSGTTTLATGSTLTASPSATDSSTKIATTSFVNTSPRIAKAWVNFDGTSAGTITPRANYNISSVTKVSDGKYVLNFTTAFSDSNYSVVTGAGNTGDSHGWFCGLLYGNSPSTSSCHITTFYENYTEVNIGSPTHVCVAIFGN